MNTINYENKLKQEYTIEINSLENAKGILDFQINRLRLKIAEIENKQDSRMYVKNNTGSPIFFGNFKIIDYVTKKSFIDNVSTSEAEVLYEKGDIEDVDRDNYLKNKKLKNNNENRTIPQKSRNTNSIDTRSISPAKERPYSFRDTESLEDQLAVEIDIRGVKDIEEKKYTNEKDLDEVPSRGSETERLISKLEGGLSFSDMMHLTLKDLDKKLQTLVKKENPEATVKTTVGKDGSIKTSGGTPVKDKTKEKAPAKRSTTTRSATNRESPAKKSSTATKKSSTATKKKEM